MAKSFDNSYSINSDFDPSKFIDLEENTEYSEDNDDSLACEGDLTTQALQQDLQKTVEDYITAARPARNEKRKLRKLAQENKLQESKLPELEKAIVAKAQDYEKLLRAISEHKNKLDFKSLTDEDTYDTELLSMDSDALSAKASELQSGDLFKELEALEATRAAINEARTRILNTVMTVATKQKDSSYIELDRVVAVKLTAINEVYNMTQAKVTPEEEKDFERGMDDLNDYVAGTYDPLAEAEDEEGIGGKLPAYVPANKDISKSETPLTEHEYTEEELSIMKESKGQKESDTSFAELFGALNEKLESAKLADKTDSSTSSSAVVLEGDLSAASTGDEDNDVSGKSFNEMAPQRPTSVSTDSQPESGLAIDSEFKAVDSSTTIADQLSVERAEGEGMPPVELEAAPVTAAKSTQTSISESEQEAAIENSPLLEESNSISEKKTDDEVATEAVKEEPKNEQGEEDAASFLNFLAGSPVSNEQEESTHEEGDSNAVEESTQTVEDATGEVEAEDADVLATTTALDPTVLETIATPIFEALCEEYGFTVSDFDFSNQSRELIKQ